VSDNDGFRLPEAFSSSGDPVEGNPFPLENPRHKVWSEATRAAEMEIAAVSAQSMARTSNFSEFMKHPLSPYEWLVAPVLVKFDIWAKRGIQVVWTDPEVLLFDKWLVEFANGWLDELSKFLDRRPPPFSRLEVLTQATNALGAKVHQWKLEARRYRELQREWAAKTAAPPSTTVGPEVKKLRQLALTNYRKSHDLSAAGFARCAGISETAIRGIVNEDKSRFSEATQSKLLSVLGLTRNQWYGIS